MNHTYETLKVSRDGGVIHVMLNRPKQGNAMNLQFWEDYRLCFNRIAQDSSCRAVVVSANGKHFSVGLDLKNPGILPQSNESDVGRTFYHTRSKISGLQETFTAMERCPQPVIVAAHGAVIGGAIDLLCAADIRLCTKDAWFSIKEVDIGLAADVGTLQRLHHVLGNQSLARELCYTARRMDSAEAKSAGFVSSVHENTEALLKHAFEMAHSIAAKSPLAVAGTKVNLNYSREHTVQESLDFIAVWNGAAILTEDIPKAAMASLSKAASPEFSKL